MSSEFDGKTRQQLISIINATRGNYERDQQRLESLLGKPKAYVFNELHGQVEHWQNEAGKAQHRLATVLDWVADNARGDKRMLGHAAAAIRELKELKADQPKEREYIARLKGENAELEARVAKLERQLAEMSDEHAELVEHLKAKARTAQPKTRRVYPTQGEIRAAHTLGVSIQQLHAWRRQGVGPQPPYDDLDAWQAWVAAEVSA